jgi:hypothetical protein
MGADFLFDCIIIKKGKNLKELEGQLLEQCKALDLHKLSTNERERIADNFNMEQDLFMFPEEVIDLMCGAIQDTFHAFESRECSGFTFKGYEIILTGGMSWGDAPTDAFDTFNRFNALPKCLHKLLN